MRKEIHPGVLAAVVVLLVAMIGGIYYYTSIASTRSGRDTSRGMNVQSAGGSVPQQQFVPHAQ